MSCPPEFLLPVQWQAVFNLRDYRKQDFDQLWRLDQECFPPGIAYTRFELGAYFRQRDSFTLVAENEKQVAGFITCHRHKIVGHVITIDVRAAARRHGVGSLLLSAAEQRLRDQGCTGVFLETAVDNLSAIRFYERHGYRAFGTIPRYYLDEIDALRMGKNLCGPRSG